MDTSNINHRRSAAIPIVALLIATAACVLLVGLRILWTGHARYWFLAGNLFLAWLPLIFAWAFWGRYHSAGRRDWKLYSLGALWLLFLPNAPYIFTDLTHLNNWLRGHYWVDLSLILLVAFTGFLLGFMSLYLMQSLVVQRFGRIAGWLFIMVTAGLTGFGVFLGRIFRWNSWDVLVNPIGLTRDIGHLAAHPVANAHSFAFPALFATFMFLGYLMLYALTHLQPPQPQMARAA
jgi:uncharacterized membrane protein